MPAWAQAGGGKALGERIRAPRTRAQIKKEMLEMLRGRGLTDYSYATIASYSAQKEWEGQTIGFPRVSATCDYASPARFEDVLEVAVALERLGTKSVTYAFTFTRDGDLIAQGKVTSVCCRAGYGLPFEAIAIPEAYRAKISPT